MIRKTANPRVLVVGCGVSGLTTGIRLLEKGFDVTIVARELPPDTTSNVAAAVWYPYKVPPTDRVLNWGIVSLNEFYRLMDLEASGVYVTRLTEVFAEDTEDPWWRGAVRGEFYQVSTDRLPAGYTNGYSVEVPLIETSKYMQYLMDRFREKGHILKANVSKLSDLYEEDRLIVNCAGVWAKKIADDKGVNPLRGQIIRVKASGVQECLVAESGPLSLTYIVPRKNDYILGGTAEKKRWEREPNPQTTKEILSRCKQLAPSLVVHEILEPLVGLRPERKEVRLEAESISERCTVIHNYGHGGAGFTLSWGCATEVADLAEDFRRKLNAMPSKSVQS